MDTKSGGFFEKYGTPLAVLLGAIIIAGAFAFNHTGTPANGGAAAPATAPDVKNVNAEASPSVGQKSAPVLMVVWYDYQCPFCKRFELDTMPQVYENYVKTGKVRIVLKDFQFLGDDSQTAAVFARAVWEAYPDRFYDWYEAMANAQDDENAGFGDLASIQKLTKDLGGIDVDRVTKLMSDKRSEYETAIAADRDEGGAMGVNGTPRILIGTTLVSGAQPYAQISALLDAELK